MGFSFKSVFKAAIVAAAVASGVGALATAGYLGAAGATIAASVASAGGLLAYAGSAALMAAVTAGVSSLLAETPKNFDLGQQLQGQLITTRAPAADARVIYGETRVGGNLVYIETTGSKNETMYQAMTLAGHEIQSIETVYVNDEALTLSLSGNAYTTTYKGSSTALSFNWLFGTDSQTALSFFSGTTAATYRFQGIAVLASKMIYNQDTFPQGIPNITAKVRGKKVYDPRTTTTAYSNNAALCIRDYLTNTTYGLGATSAEIDDVSFEDAADICDENVNLAAGGTEKRYTINGAFSTAEPPKEVLAKMLTACSGKLSYIGGKWVLRVGAYRSPSMTITADDIVGGISMQASQSRRDIFNAVKGTYSEPGVLYQPNSFPPVTNATYESQDGEQIWKDIQFPFTTSSSACQRLAKIDLEKARQQISVQLACNLKAFALQPGDTVNLTFDRYGWSSKVFDVLTWEFSFSDSETGPTPIVNLMLRETAAGVYTWSAEETAIDLAPNTNLPDPFTVVAPGVAVSDTLAINAETIVTKLLVSVTGENTFQNRYEVQAKVTTDATYINLGQASGNLFELSGAIDGAIYDVRARTINGLGVRSSWTETTHEVIGKTAPPQDVTNFSINVVGTDAHLTWDPVTDLDLSHYRIRHSRLTTGATYAEAIDLIFKLSRPGVSATVPAMTGTYFIKAVDKLGNDSVNPTEIVAIIEDIKGLNAVETITESPTFAGTKVECAVDDTGRLVLDTAVDFDDVSGLFDDADGDFDGGGGTVSTAGTYDFANVVDLGSVYTSRVTAFVEFDRIEYVNLFDDATGNFDDRQGLFDGDPNVFDDCNVELYISTTEDDPAGTPTWTAYRQFFVGDYKARAYRFRARLTSEGGESSPAVTSLSVTVDMPDRVAYDNDIISGAGAKVVAFAPAFKASPAIAITAQNLSQGDYFTITSKSSSGFTITFYDSGANAVSRTFDWVARGYGELAA